MCKQVVTPPNQAPRNCRAKEYADGWCHLHHPEIVEAELVRTLRWQERKMQREEDQAIGMWMREKHPAIFEQLRDEIEEARIVCANVEVPRLSQPGERELTMPKRQPFREWPLVSAALEFANSPACDKAAKKHIEAMVARAEAFKNGMNRWQDMVRNAKRALTYNAD